MRTRGIAVFALLAGFIMVQFFSPVLSSGAEKKKGSAPIVSEGKLVKVKYTLKVDGKVVNSSNSREPFQFKVGSHQIIPGFEKAVMGMKAGEKKSFAVSPADGYGQVNPKAIREVPRAQLPPEMKPQAGMLIGAKGKEGQTFPVKIVEVKKDAVLIDFNHPLAGKTLHFDVEVVEIK